MEDLSGKKITRMKFYEEATLSPWRKREKQLKKEGWTKYEYGKPVEKRTSKRKTTRSGSGINISKGISVSVRKGQAWARRSGRKGPLLRP